jgi:hypothetical protein
MTEVQPHHRPRNNEFSQPWIKTAETVSQKKSFLLLNYFPQVFVMARKN